jgi:hypothetical protein
MKEGRTFIRDSVVAGHALLVVRLGLCELVRVHDSSGELPQLRQDEVGKDATKDDTPLVSDADDLEDVVADDGDVDDGELWTRFGGGGGLESAMSPWGKLRKSETYGGEGADEG